MKQLTASQFAKLCGVTAQTVTNWRGAGMPCVGAGRQGVRAKIDITKALPWVIARRDVRPGSERERLTRAQADRIEMENRLRCGELCEAHDVELEVARILKICAHGFEIAVDGLERDVGLTPAQAEYLEQHFDSCRKRLYLEITNDDTATRDSGAGRSNEDGDRDDHARTGV